MNLFNRSAHLAALTIVLLFFISSAHAVNLPHYTGELLPRPQEVVTHWQMLPLSQGADIESPEHPDGALSLGIQLLKQRLESVGVKADAADGMRLVLGEQHEPVVREALKAIGADLTKVILPPQGYVIRIGQADGRRIVVGAGADSRGTFYAAATLIQMIGTPAGRPTLKIADLNDWPTWQYRYLGDYGPVSPDDMIRLALYKVGQISFQHRYEWRQFNPDAKPRYSKYATYGEALKAFKAFKDQTGLIDAMLILNIYAATPRVDPIFNATDAKDMDELTQRLEFAAGMGVDRIMVSADDWTPMEEGGYVAPHQSERERFGLNAGATHGYVMRQLYDRLKPKFPELQLSFCPAPYSISHITRHDPVKQRRYLMELAEGMPPDIAIVWTGPAVTSERVERKDFLQYSDDVLHHPLMLWNNSYNIPGMRRFTNRFYDGFAADSNGVIYIDSFTFTQAWSQAFSISTNDYLWNPNGFETDVSFREVVAKQYGVESLPPVDEYISGYQRLADAQKKRDTKAALAAIATIRKAIEEMKVKKLSWWQLEGIVNQQAARYEAKPPSTQVPELAAAPDMNGRIDDAVWEKAGAITLFQPYNNGANVESTTGRIGYHDGALYLAFTAIHAKPLPPRTSPAAHDAPIFATSDAIEIFLAADASGKSVHLVFDAYGDRFDEADGQGSRWNPDWQVVTTQVDPHTWTAEVRIPFASIQPVIGQTPKAGSTWRANFCRANMADNQLSSWSSTYGNTFHTRTFFGQLQFIHAP